MMAVSAFITVSGCMLASHGRPKIGIMFAVVGIMFALALAIMKGGAA